MTSSDISSEQVSRLQKYLEFLVPVLSFGITGIGIFFWRQGFVLNYQFFSAGCIISSCILAYLAWIRPHKDIVAISTPVYAFIFFLVPSDDLSWMVLQLLYAASLTILLVRLKYRFGPSAPGSGTLTDNGPLEDYVRKIEDAFPAITPAIAGDAGMVFARFAQGEYEAAARLAAARSEDPSTTLPEVSARAFAIISDQAARTSEGTGVPDHFRRFSPDHYPVLYFPPSGTGDPEDEYTEALDNALLLLYAISQNPGAGSRKADALSFKKFAGKIARLEG